MVQWTDFIKEDFSAKYENADLYKSQYLPKVEAYRKKLQDSLKPEYKIELPDTIENLEKNQTDVLALLYEKKYLSEEELQITDSSAAAIVEKIAAGKWTSVQVLQAFARRAVIAHQFLNCNLEVFIDEGLKRAQELDDYYKKNGKTVGPLHGLPISLKEQINYAGKATHGSYVSLVDDIVDQSAVSKDILENLGAVFYVRTNQPQTIMHLCGNNNFIGWSRVPKNISLSSGGSSSGEGSIVSFGGSPLGVGSDIGGSIRSPAAFAGCHGLRPSTFRISKKPGVSAAGGQETIPGVQGPLARSVDDIDLFMDLYINQGKPWEHDATVLPLPWRKVEKPAPKDLTVGVIYDNGVVKPTPPIRRGLKETAAKLAAAGVKVVEFPEIESQRAWELARQTFAADGNEAQKKLLKSGEPLCKLTKWALNYGGEEKDIGVYNLKQINIERDGLKQKYTDYMNKHGIDIILSPTYENVAPHPETAYNWSYTSLFNLIDFPTLVVQTGLYQDPAKDKWTLEYPKNPRNDFEELCLDLYEPELYKGAPIGLQLTGRRYFDEEVVAAGKTVVDILGVDLYKN